MGALSQPLPYLQEAGPVEASEASLPWNPKGLVKASLVPA